MNAAFYQGLEVRYLKCLHQYKGKYKSEGKKIKYIIPYSLYNIIPKRSNLPFKLHQKGFSSTPTIYLYPATVLWNSCKTELHDFFFFLNPFGNNVSTHRTKEIPVTTLCSPNNETHGTT
jgi:hypothetical protein